MREENAVSSKAVNQRRAEEVTRGECMNAASAMWQLQQQMQTSGVRAQTLPRAKGQDVAMAIAQHRNVTVLESPSMIKGVTNCKRE